MRCARAVGEGGGGGEGSEGCEGGEGGEGGGGGGGGEGAEGGGGGWRGWSCWGSNRTLFVSSEYGSMWAAGAVGVLEERNACGRWVWGEGGKRLGGERGEGAESSTTRRSPS